MSDGHKEENGRGGSSRLSPPPPPPPPTTVHPHSKSKMVSQKSDCELVTSTRSSKKSAPQVSFERTWETRHFVIVFRECHGWSLFENFQNDPAMLFQPVKPVLKLFEKV